MHETTRTKRHTERRGALEVLIVGAGPTGLTLACALARAGVSSRLVEASVGPQPGSRGKGLQPRSLEVFEDLGIVERVLANGRMAMPIRTTAPDGQMTMGGVDVPKARPDVPYWASVITPQWRTEEALRWRLGEFGGAVEFGTTLEHFEQSDTGVSAILVKGERSETVTARWLVGCDGGKSVVRKQAGITFEGETDETIRMIVADVEVDGLDRDAWHMWRHPMGMVTLCPLPSTNVFQYQAGITPGVEPDLGRAHLQAVFEQFSGRTDLRLHTPHWASLWRLNVRIVDRYREGRVFLAGDAAHIHAPAGGQGMNTGIQDAHNLGWKLAAVARGSSEALLDTYDAERRPVAAGVLALSNALLEQVLEQKGIVARRDGNTLQLGVGYRDSVLARDDRDETAPLRAGDRAPDATDLATVDGEKRLFELTRGGLFTLLNFGAAPTSADQAGFEMRTLSVAERPTKIGEVTDTAGHLARAYGASERTLVLIRPDGYVGLVSDAGDAAALSEYFAAMR